MLAPLRLGADRPGKSWPQTWPGHETSPRVTRSKRARFRLRQGRCYIADARRRTPNAGEPVHADVRDHSGPRISGRSHRRDMARGSLWLRGSIAHRRSPGATSIWRGALVVSQSHSPDVAPGSGHSVMVRVEAIDAHFLRAREHGAPIIRDLEDFPLWRAPIQLPRSGSPLLDVFETIRDVDPAEWGGELD